MCEPPCLSAAEPRWRAAHRLAAPRPPRPPLQEVAGALAYLHSRSVLHGDLTPGNVLLCKPPPKSRRHPRDPRGFQAKVGGRLGGAGARRPALVGGLQCHVEACGRSAAACGCQAKAGWVRACTALAWASSATNRCPGSLRGFRRSRPVLFSGGRVEAGFRTRAAPSAACRLALLPSAHLCQWCRWRTLGCRGFWMAAR